MEKAKRKSGIELLRIICMLSIIVLHAYCYGGIDEIADQRGGMFLGVSNFIWSFFRTPVNVFVIITGYFMSKDSLDFQKSYKRIPKVYLTMLFYSITATLAALLINNTQGLDITGSTNGYTSTADELNVYSQNKLSGNLLIYSIIKMFFPILSSEWYFLTNYIIILLLSPFINYVLNGIDKKQFKILLGLLFVFLSILPTLSDMGGFKEIFSTKKVVPLEYGKSLISFIFMYIIGAYLKRFVKDDEKIHIKYLVFFIVLCFADFSLYLFGNGIKFNNIGLYNGSVFGQFSNPLVILESVSIFLFFRGFQFRSKIINYIAGTTIGIYAIHEHPLLRGFIWSHNDFSYSGFYSDPFGIPIMILMILGIFAGCALIDAARQGIFKGVEVVYRRIRVKKQKSE